MTEKLAILPLGFLAGGVAAGIKSDPGKLDVAVFLTDRPSVAAGVFTQNRVTGAPVKISRGRVPARGVRGVVINSGNANAATGEQGVADARYMTDLVARGVGCREEDILVCSTGVIGKFLPREKLAKGIPAAVQQAERSCVGFRNAARGMMTTDTFPKQVSHVVRVGEGVVIVSGACKGAAMIAPNMATMLGVVMTDAALTIEQASRMLKVGVDRSFNCISVDQHTSTSDTVLLLANGASGVVVRTPEEEALVGAAIEGVCRELALKIIRDAEGAEHFVTIDVRGSRDDGEARRIAREVANSPLVKTAIAGNDPNWGRIVSAAGYAGVAFEEEDLSLSINGIEVYRSGTPVEHDARAVSDAMKTGEVVLELSFRLGQGTARYWTSDLTCEYVRLNSEYTT